MAFAQPAAQGRAHFVGKLALRVQRAVVDVADQGFFFLIAHAGQVDKRARVGGNNQADALGQT